MLQNVRKGKRTSGNLARNETVVCVNVSELLCFVGNYCAVLPAHTGFHPGHRCVTLCSKTCTCLCPATLSAHYITPSSPPARPARFLSSASVA